MKANKSFNLFSVFLLLISTFFPISGNAQDMFTTLDANFEIAGTVPDGGFFPVTSANLDADPELEFVIGSFTGGSQCFQKEFT